MPYLIQVLKGKEKKIGELLARHGLTTQRATLTEYLLTDDPACYEIRRRDTVTGYILNISEVSAEVADELLTIPDCIPSDNDTPLLHKLVRIRSGQWAGAVGIVSRIKGDMVTIHAETFGYLKRVEVPLCDVEICHAPEGL